MLTVLFPMHTEGAGKIRVSCSLRQSGQEIEAATYKVCFTTRGLLCYLDFGH